ncbi:replication initiation and membrane attachment family protein [Pontibacillus yanchengensis]|uniref:Helicase DnaB n=1 Tax=Pontibacillus yanchengensis Y32 TaxID=1385514 RepID=A0A0A2TBC3_9BACI|nr:DnaD domain protein [Pontibacillus yanchengensis]KGP71728.1 helicase DnaB [Pontibacillus yanchengensis Y32]
MNETNIGKLLPLDGFKLQVPQNIAFNMSTSLTHLYQPLIGLAAISLYQTLLSEYEVQKKEDQPRTHHLLMNYLHLPLDQIYEARKRLEAIGLMRSFLTEGTQQNVYTYVLLRPFTPNEFFEDDMLSLLLYHHIGEEKFKRLQHALYAKPIVEDQSIEVTSSFEEIFSMRELPNDVPSNPESEEMTKTIATSTTGANVQESSIDFDWLKSTFHERMLPVNVIFTEKNKKVMNQLALLYNLATYEMEKAIQWALSDSNELHVSELKEACHDLYQSKHQNGQGNIKLTEHREKVNSEDKLSNSSDEDQQPQGKEEALINQLEHISPRQLLTDLSNGAEPTEKELKIVRDIMTSQGLPAGVMNVLIYYVLLKTDMKLSKPYMETIAGHWARLDVKTVRQAMDTAKSENQKYQQLATKGKNRNRRQKQEVLPDWFKEQQKEKEAQPQTKGSEKASKSQQEIEKEKKELAEALKKMDDE